MNSNKKLNHFQTDHLINFCESITDCHHSSPVYKESGKIVIRNFNIKKGRLILLDVSYTDEETFNNRIARAKPEPGDLIITREAPMGEICIIPKGLDCCLGQRMVLIKPNENKVDNKYLLYSLLSQYVQIQINKSEGTGSIVSNLRIPVLKELNIPNRGLNEQKLIGKVLADLDSKIELNNRINTELEAMAKTLYDYWFVQFDFPDANGKPYKTSGGKMLWNEELKRAIPEGWEVKELGNILAKESTTTKIPSSEILEYGLIPVIDQSTSYIKGFTNDKSSVIKTDSARIIFGDHTRILKLINFDFARGADGTQVLLSKNEKMPQHLFYHSLLKIDLSNYGYARHFKFLKDSKIIIPSKKTATEFEEIATGFYNKIKGNIFQNQELASLRDWLLPMLMNGQVSVGDVEEELRMVAEARERYGK